MSRIKRNLLANFAGMGWTALMGLACTPFYIMFLGIEAYGLIGFYLMLQTGLQILDFGLSPTMNREMARYSVMPEKVAEARDFVKTLGTLSWSIGTMIVVMVLLAAPYIANHWIQNESIPTLEIQRAVMIMGGLVALQLPIGFYQGGLLGLEHQVILNVLKISMITLGNGGAVLVLWKISPTITAFFGWQILIYGAHVSLLMFFLWRSLPHSGRSPRFEPSLLRNVWRFASGMTGITISAIILTQLDKVVLSRLLSLKVFGYYTLAGVVASGLYMIINPIFNAVFPRFSSLAATGNEEELSLLYHRSSQLMAVLVIPLASVIALFSHDIVLLWTGNMEVANNASPIISILVVGTAMNGLMNTPYALQLSHGWTRIGLTINAFLIVLFIPSILFMTTHYGPIGAASVWMTLNGIHMSISIPFTHRRLLKGEARHWLLYDVVLPLAGTIIVVVLGRKFITSLLTPLSLAFSLLCLLMVAIIVAAFSAPETRVWVLNQSNNYLPKVFK
jgi:O-antigen/teichoic acid export membrane protein